MERNWRRQKELTLLLGRIVLVLAVGKGIVQVQSGWIVELEHGEAFFHQFHRVALDDLKAAVSLILDAEQGFLQRVVGAKEIPHSSLRLPGLVGEKKIFLHTATAWRSEKRSEERRVGKECR